MNGQNKIDASHVTTWGGWGGPLPRQGHTRPLPRGPPATCQGHTRPLPGRPPATSGAHPATTWASTPATSGALLSPTWGPPCHVRGTPIPYLGPPCHLRGTPGHYLKSPPTTPGAHPAPQWHPTFSFYLQFVFLFTSAPIKASFWSNHIFLVSFNIFLVSFQLFQLPSLSFVCCGSTFLPGEFHGIILMLLYDDS